MHKWKKKFKVESCYNERHRGKGQMNEIGSTIKNKVRDVKVHLKDAKFFAEDADLVIDNIKSL